jgi:hypothetical protein
VRRIKAVWASALAGLVIDAGGKAIADEDTDALIKDALSAAPPTLIDKATVVDWDGNVLKEGMGNYTCFPTPPQLQGTAPMCFDGPWMAWADAWQNKKDLAITKIGSAARRQFCLTLYRYASHCAKEKALQWDIRNTSGGIVPAANIAATHGVGDTFIVE